MSDSLHVVERFAAVDAALVALVGVGEVLFQVGNDDLGPALRRLDDLARRVAAAQVAVVGEAMARGVMASDVVPDSDLDGDLDDGLDDGLDEGPQALAAGVVAASGVSGVDWVAAWAPSLRPSGATKVVRLWERLRALSTSALDPELDSVLEPVKAAVLSGRVGVSNASVVVAEIDALTPRLVPAAVPTVLTGLVEVASRFGPREVRQVRPRLLARYGQAGELQQVQDAAARRVALSQPFDDGDGICEYRLRLDAEGSAVLEAALAPLSAPRPSETGPDLRGSDRRRADGLVDLVRRAVSNPEGAPLVAKAQLVVTMTVDDLTQQVRAGTTLGVTGGSTPLAAGTVRRLACDAALIPAVLGSDSHVLDLGRTVRLFTTAQVKALWLRDKTCSIPGCSMPAPYCDAHHLTHWADGGPTNVGNGTLLCGYHHRWVHDRDLTGSIGPDGHLDWNLNPGSYSVALRQHRAERRPSGQWQ